MIATYRRERSQGGVAGRTTARLIGTLAEADGCLVIANDGGPSIQPVFPEGGARWDDTTRRLIFDGAAYPIDSKIAVGGGGVGDEVGFATRSDMSIPTCRGARLFIVGP